MSENPANPQDQRDDLFERAKVGEITGEQADAEAIRLGLGSLSRRPGPDEFRPEAETHWTLAMAVAWIAYLDLDEVREWSAPYRTHCFDWHWQRWRRGLDGPIYEGWHLEQRSKPTLSLLGIGASIDRAEDNGHLKMSIGEAEKALWVALRTDYFRASGLNENGRRVEIPPLEWNDLKLILGRGDREELCFDFDRVAYKQVLLPAASIRGLWREPVESVEQLPPTMRPEGDGFMPLYCAAHWIATEGGTLDFLPKDPPRWRAAYAALLAAITSDKVRVVGMKGGEREIIGGHVFAGIQVDYPFDDPDLDLTVGSELYLRSYPFLDEEHWQRGFDDALIRKREDKWTRLMVDKASVRLLWPFDAEQEKLDQRTGLPGRPGKAKHLIEDELARRAAERRLAPTLTEEANALRAWLSVRHPKTPRPAMVTIRNNIRHEYNRLKTSTK